MGYYRNILSHNHRLCLCPSGPPTPHHRSRFASREYCRFCIQSLLVPYGPTHPKKNKKKKNPRPRSRSGVGYYLTLLKPKHISLEFSPCSVENTPIGFKVSSVSSFIFKFSTIENCMGASMSNALLQPKTSFNNFLIVHCFIFTISSPLVIPEPMNSARGWLLCGLPPVDLFIYIAFSYLSKVYFSNRCTHHVNIKTCI